MLDRVAVAIQESNSKVKSVKLLRQFLRRTPFYPSYKRLGHWPDYWYWQLRGRPKRPPHLAKQKLLKQYAQRYSLRILVETGTYFGEMVSATKHDFDEIFTVEFDSKLAAAARKQFSSLQHVHVLEGSSEALIPQVLAQLTQPALFWLDAGYCAWNGSFADSARLLNELHAILSHPLRHIVLIDDVVPFSGIDGTPDVAELQRHITSQFPARNATIDAGLLVIT